jgi:hypothetical protein
MPFGMRMNLSRLPHNLVGIELPIRLHARICSVWKRSVCSVSITGETNLFFEHPQICLTVFGSLASSSAIEDCCHHKHADDADNLRGTDRIRGCCWRVAWLDELSSRMSRMNRSFTSSVGQICGHVVGTKFWTQNRSTVFIASELAFFSGRDRRRSGDLTLFRRALYLLSYPTG